MGNCHSVFSCFCWRYNKKKKGRDEMGNQQSSPVDIPVYYKAGFGVSLYKPVENSGTDLKVRNRKIGQFGANGANQGEVILKGNVRSKQRNGVKPVEHTDVHADVDYLSRARNIENHARTLNELRIEIDESGFVDEEAGAIHEQNGDKLSNSLKGNFSPTSLHEKNLRLDEDCNSNSENSYNLNGNRDTNGKRPSLDHLDLGPKLGKSSVLLTPPSEDESSGSHPAKSSSHTGPVTSHSTKSDVSDIHSEIAEHEHEPVETDEEREQLSPLPYDRITGTHDKICTRKLKLKLAEIVSRSTSQSANSSTCSTPDSFLLSFKQTGSSDYQNSISGISSPDLDLLNSDSADIALDASTFVELEDEIHGVEDEFENISREIHALSNKYSNHETGSHIFKEIFLRYPSIRVRQSEKGIHIFSAESDTESVSGTHSGVIDEDSKDLSWDMEYVMDAVYSDSSEAGGMLPGFLRTSRPNSRSSVSKADLPVDVSGNTSCLDNSSINCSVDLGGSLYEDEFHLHLGTKALPKIEERSPDSKGYCDMLGHLSATEKQISQSSMQDKTSQIVETTGTSQSVDNTGTSHNVENTETSQSVETTGTSHNVENTETSQSVEKTGTSQTVENIETSPQFEIIEHSEHTDSSKAGSSSCGNSVADNSDMFESGPGTGMLDTGYCSMEIGNSPIENMDLGSPMPLDTPEASPCSPSTTCSPNTTCSPDTICSPNTEYQACSPVNISALCNIGERVEIEEYANEEWKGNTPTATLIREAYKSIPTHCECCHLRRIRGDNYCGIRSTLYQTMVNGLPPLNLWASKTEAYKRLMEAYGTKSSGIHRWNFAKRISYNSENRLEIMHKCLTNLYSKIEEMKQHSSYVDREQLLVRILNSDLDSDLDSDLELLEGVKILMLLSALHLHGDMEQGNDVPVFAWLLFARDTSENMSSFVRNHLNQVGDSGGLEQVEMCLLGYSLGVRIRVFRLKQYNDEDFISYYPEDGAEDWPVVSLIAEDDRHYNVPVL